MAIAHVAAATSTGLVRKRNEDSAYAGRWLCAVADGMGGHAAGDVASATVIDAIRSFDVRADDPVRLTTILGAAVMAANSELTAKVRANANLGNMGSTLTAMLWSADHFAIANIGDSRAYLLRNKVCKHSAHARAVMGSAGFGGCYGESACAGGRQGLPSMRSCRTSMAWRPCLRAVSM